MADTLRIEVLYALPGSARSCRLELPPGARVADALERAAGEAQFAALEVTGLPVAIFGRRVAPGDALKDGDRVELLRPLLHDPKEARRRRVSRSGGS